MVESPSFVRVKPKPAFTLEPLVRIFRSAGGGIVALVAGPKRAGRAAAFETILGSALLGLVLALALHVVAAKPAAPASTTRLDAIEIGLWIGAAFGTALHLLHMALEEHAADKNRRDFGDN